jgi:hypothetical protein
MSGRLKQLIDDFFTLSKSEQRGIFMLAILVIIILVVTYLLPFFDSSSPVDHSEHLNKIEQFRKSQQETADSIRVNRLQEKGRLGYDDARQILKPFAFNPNNLPEEKWLAMGLSQKQATTIINYIAKGGQFKTKEDLKKIYCLSEGEYRVLEPYILLPASGITSGKKTEDRKQGDHKKRNSKGQRFILTEINSQNPPTLLMASTTSS